MHKHRMNQNLLIDRCVAIGARLYWGYLLQYEQITNKDQSNVN